MDKFIPYIHRDVSWLAFNYRVLQEVKDPNVPLYERIKFLAIYSSNLGEFFRVRVANLKNLIRAGKKTSKDLDYEPKQLLSQILKIVTRQQEEVSRIFKGEIVPALKREGINFITNEKLTSKQKDFVNGYFENDLAPYIQPILLRGKMIKPFLENGSLYLGLYMRSRNEKDKEKYYALVKIPSDQEPRFVILPSKESHEVMILDDLIRVIIPRIFPGFKIINSFSLKLSRDAEMYIDDEYSGDLIQKIKKGLKKRDIGLASRLVFDRSMPKHFIEYLKRVFNLEDMDLVPEGRYHNNFDFIKFPDFKKKELKDISLPPLDYSYLSGDNNVFDSIKESDHLLYFPYHSYAPVVKFFQDAAEDDRVTHIKIIQYRVAKNSKIMEALMKAVKNGKQVTAFVEIKARFDEEANLNWGEQLEANGVNVIYSLPGLKVHSKMAMVRRVVNGTEEIFAYLSTGNFNESTARVYTDFGLFTSDKRLVSEAQRVFYYLETKKHSGGEFKHFGVGTFNLKNKLIKLIENEIANAKKGKPAYMKLKMNSIQDKQMIDLLYNASEAGVKIELIVRGICSIVPGIKGVSQNIVGVSIIDKFLEHARVFIFGNGGDELIYLSSADWMVRNLHHRVETMFPIFDEHLKYLVRSIIKIQLSDNVKARKHDAKNSNKYKKDKGLPVRSQYDTYYFLRRRSEQRKSENITNIEI